MLELIAQGLSNKEVGKSLGITEETTKVHVRNIMEKLNVEDRTEAVTMRAAARDHPPLLTPCVRS